MRNTLVILFVALAFGANAQITPAKKTFYYEKNAHMQLKEDQAPLVGVDIVPGDKLVFFYEWQSAKNPQIADADRTDKLYFEISAKEAKSFQASGEALGKLSAVRCRLCFCVNGGCRRATEGVLTIKKVGCGKYAVTFKDSEDADKLLVNETFSLKKKKQ